MNLSTARKTLWEKGYLKLENFLTTNESEEIVKWIDQVQEWPDSADRWLHHYEVTPAGIRLSRSENIVPYHPELAGFLTGGKVITTMAGLFDEPAVLYKEKINYKYPGGGDYAPHQDAPAYHPLSKHFTCLIPTADITIENGCLYFSPRAVADGMMPTDEAGCIPGAVASKMDWMPVELGARDILIFHSFVPHRSGQNSTSQARRVLYVTYNALSEGDLRTEYYEWKKRKLAAAEHSNNPDKKGRISLIGHFRGKTTKKP